MAYLTIARISGDPDRLLERYRESSDAMAEVGRDYGLILHTAARTAAGIMLVNLWESREGSEGAAADPRRAVELRRSELRPEQIHKEHHDVENHVVAQAAGTATATNVKA